MTDQYPETRIVILNYNGSELLPQCLPSIMQAVRETNFTKVTVLDNCSTDNGLEYVATNFGDCHIEKAASNRLLCSYNEYLNKIKEPVVILLNNDMRVHSDFIKPLVSRFLVDPLIFLVAPKTMAFDGKTIEAGQSKAGIRFGLFECTARYPGYEEEAVHPAETFSSGFGAFSREKFLELNGYDELYLPGIMEDVDLCYRARRAGYHLYYEPKSVVYHMGQASFKKRFGFFQTHLIAHRNNFLFMWKNFSSPQFWFLHLLFLIPRMVWMLLKGRTEFILAFFKALARIKPIMDRRRQESKINYKLTEREAVSFV